MMRHFVDQEMTKSPALSRRLLIRSVLECGRRYAQLAQHLFPFPSHHGTEPPDRHFSHAQRYIRPPSRLFATRPPSPRRPFLHAGRVQRDDDDDLGFKPPLRKVSSRVLTHFPPIC